MMRISPILILFAACGGVSKPVHGPSDVHLKVADAALPFHTLNAKNGRQLSAEEFGEAVRNAQAVCVGETHTDVYHHWGQLQVLEMLQDDMGTVGEFALGMEMFQRPFQGVLDDFARGNIGEDALLSRSDWERRWNFDWEFYAPMVRNTVGQRGVILALNISKELKDKWKKIGTSGLSEEDRAKLPEIDLNNQAHREWFRSLMEGMGNGHHPPSDHAPSEEAGTAPQSPHKHRHKHHNPDHDGPEPKDFIDKIYPVQVLWDETMADTAVKWLQAGENRRILLIAGNGHCHDSGIVARMKRRGIERVISIRPVVETGNGEVADLLASPENDYLFVMVNK